MKELIHYFGMQKNVLDAKVMKDIWKTIYYAITAESVN